MKNINKIDENLKVMNNRNKAKILKNGVKDLRSRDRNKNFKTKDDGFMSHLIELRKRLVFCVLLLLIVFFICFYFADYIFNFLIAPLYDIWGDDANKRFIYTALQEKFLTNVKLSFFSSLIICFPLILIQVWKFVAPALYSNEKKAFLPFLIFTPLLFYLGTFFVYYFVMPIAWEFFTSFEYSNNRGVSIELEPKVGEYLSLVMQLIFAFSISFELPIILTLLVKIGLTSSNGLRRKRRYAIVLAFIASAILTPPDPLSQIALAIPIILLYELSIISGRLIEKTRKIKN